MGKIVTGLIAVSLIASPASETMLCADSVEHKNAIFSSLNGKDNNGYTAGGIDRMLSILSKNSQDIVRLMKHKLSAVSKIQTVMEVKALTRQSVSDEQIEVYRSFKDDYEKQSTKLYGILETIRISGDMKDVQKAVLSDDEESVYSGLKTVSNYQSEAIIWLNKILMRCDKTLSRLA